MNLSRRTFIRSGSVAFCTYLCLINPLTTAARQQKRLGELKEKYEIPYEAKLDPVYHYTRATFEPHLNTPFYVHAGVKTSTLTLIEIEDCGKRTKGVSGECFSLLFRASEKLSFVQTIYNLEHAALGVFSLFLTQTRIGRDPEGLYYVAIINHMREDATQTEGPGPVEPPKPKPGGRRPAGAPTPTPTGGADKPLDRPQTKGKGKPPAPGVQIVEPSMEWNDQ